MACAGWRDVPCRLMSRSAVKAGEEEQPVGWVSKVVLLRGWLGADLLVGSSKWFPFLCFPLHLFYFFIFLSSIKLTLSGLESFRFCCAYFVLLSSVLLDRCLASDMAPKQNILSWLLTLHFSLHCDYCNLFVLVTLIVTDWALLQLVC